MRIPGRLLIVAALLTLTAQLAHGQATCAYDAATNTRISPIRLLLKLRFITL